MIVNTLLTDPQNLPTAAPPAQFCLHKLIEAQVKRTPEGTAIVFEEDTLSYRELNAHANQLADRLSARGVGPEVCVGVCLERSLELAVTVLGVLKAGGVIVPLDPEAPLDRQQLLLGETSTEVVVTQTKWLNRLPQLRVDCLCLDMLEEIPEFPDHVHEAARVTPDNLCAIFFTSGSTGTPKGVMVPHRVSSRMLWAQASAIPLAASDRRLLTSSLVFASFLGEFCSPLFVGGAVVFARPNGYQDIDYLVETIATHQITVVGFVPSILRLLLQRLADRGADACRSLRHIFSHGEALPPELQALLAARFDAGVHKFYGLTEAPAATYWNCKGSEDAARTTIGQPTDMEVYLLDHNLDLVPNGTAGEIYVGGPGMARGYLGRPDLTAERFLPNPFAREPGARLFRTGDLGRWLPEGVIEFLGRIDDQVKIRGIRVELGEIEAALYQEPSVSQAVVCVRPFGSGDQRLVAYVVPHSSGSASTVSALRHSLQQKLPAHLIPSAFVILDEFPLLPNGKVDRKALPAPESAATDIKSSARRPTDPLECELAEIWESLLDVRPVGRDANFFDLGGHSLLVLNLLGQIEKTFGTKLPITALTQALTLSELATFLRERLYSAAPLTPTGQTDAQPSLFCIDFRLSLADVLGKDLPMYELATDSQDVLSHSRIETLAASYVRNVRDLQPEGPYFLSGFGSSGILAFEMAQQLIAAGQQVPFLGILQTRLFPHPAWFVLKRLLHHGKTLARLKPASWGRFLRGRLQAAQNHIALQTPRAADNAPSTPRADEITRLQAHYRPRPYPGPITLFLTNENPRESNQEMRSAWRKLAAKLEVVDVPGYDCTMFDKPNVYALGEQMKARIQAAAGTAVL